MSVLIVCADSVAGSTSDDQSEGGGSNPTSALQISFKEITSNEARQAYANWHYLKDTRFLSKVNFGAFFQGSFEGAISYGSPNASDLKGCFTRQNQIGWWEIKRLVLSPRCPRNSESRFIAITLKLLRKIHKVEGVVTYADSSQGHVGTIYKASGFESRGLTALKNDYWVNGRIQQRGKTKGVGGVWKPRSQKWLFVKRYPL